jgi:hypothetical protein
MTVRAPSTTSAGQDTTAAAAVRPAVDELEPWALVIGVKAASDGWRTIPER